MTRPMQALAVVAAAVPAVAAVWMFKACRTWDAYYAKAETNAWPT